MDFFNSRCIIITKKEKNHKTSLNAYLFFTRVGYKYDFPQNCKMNENKSSKFEVTPTALLLLVNFGTCKQNAQEVKLSWKHKQPLLGPEEKNQNKCGGSV